MEKYCAWKGREIFCKVGLSVESIARLLIDLAGDTNVAGGTRVQALSVASKCLGLQREIVEGAGGAKIIWKEIKMHPGTRADFHMDEEAGLFFWPGAFRNGGRNGWWPQKTGSDRRATRQAH